MNGASKYQMFTLLGNEFTFDVDVSKLGYVHLLQVRQERRC